MKIKILILFIFLQTIGRSQSNIYFSEYAGTGAETAYSIIKIGASLFTVGSTSTFGQGQSDGLLNTYNLSGNLVSSKAYGGAQNEEFRKIKQLQDGNLLMVGLTSSFSNYAGNDSNIYVMKTDVSGTILWTKTFGGPGCDFAVDVIENGDNSLLILGNTTSIGAGGMDIMLVKIDQNGNYLWSKSQGSSGRDSAASFISSSNGYVICGKTGSFGIQGFAPFTIRVDAIGDCSWAKTYEFQTAAIDNSIGYDVIQGFFNDYILVGKIAAPNSSGFASPYIIDMDTSGNLLWAKKYLICTGDCRAYSVAKTSDNNFLLSGAEATYLWSGKVSPNGQLIFSKYHNDGAYTYNPYGWTIESCEVPGGYIHAGTSNTPGDFQSALISTDLNGQIGTCSMNTPYNSVSILSPIITSRTFSKTTSNYTLLDTSLVMSGVLNRTTYCFGAGIEDNDHQSVVKIYPNPSTGTVSISLPENTEQMQITNSLGEILNQKLKITSLKEEVDLSGLKPGIYFITIKTPEGYMTAKLIKE